MAYTEIYYKTLKDGKDFSAIVQDLGNDYKQSVINMVEAITDAKETDGTQCAVITGIRQYE